MEALAKFLSAVRLVFQCPVGRFELACTMIYTPYIDLQKFLPPPTRITLLSNGASIQARPQARYLPIS